jgi:hypothetical protein
MIYVHLIAVHVIVLVIDHVIVRMFAHVSVVHVIAHVMMTGKRLRRVRIRRQCEQMYITFPIMRVFPLEMLGNIQTKNHHLQKAK